MPFRFVDRFQASLRRAIVGNDGDEMAYLLEQRDQQVEAFLDELERVSVSRYATVDFPKSGDYTGQLAYDSDLDITYKWTGTLWRTWIATGTYTPTLGNITGGAPAGVYALNGWNLTFTANIGTTGPPTATAAGPVTLSLPLGLANASSTLPQACTGNNAASVVGARLLGGATAVSLYKDVAGINFAAGDAVTNYRVSGTVVVA